jgi:dolichyl-phosphate beta-glucosyltransferase
VHATLVSIILGLQVYDTDCCAKLFRNGPVTSDLFRDPFSTAVSFDTEIFVRLLERMASRGDLNVEVDCIEAPLRTWRRRARRRYGSFNARHVLTDLGRIHLRMRSALPRGPAQ